ncbi:CRISPR-associated protein Cas4 [Exiguobacterium sp. SH31]|uniref:CRISPR-associated protein Cas4 n=1 Tax=unclassified Exiguobacterium TaxID=2644629 RepID=UPI0008C9CA79|nr:MULTISPECIES: CRISPR-associated protein Cas4 [unclassified Exiguobacterium]OGX78733.1 CRISPR-associated protein Cas4 [Exiguobacterium sp. SH31]TCI56159.1 CRISPR-associated protein Cas4 [Exiguobacterium sp. SH5S13]
MDYKQDDSYLLLSGIQHFQFCPRQWALIHIEQQWEENSRTIEGQHLHKKADDPFAREKRKDKLIVRGMAIKSEVLNVSGQCDIVEFVQDPAGVSLYGNPGTYRPIPVEYKRGKPKVGKEDELQLAAQAICLEEMFLCEITEGYLYYNETKHRHPVLLSESLKHEVREIVEKMNDYYRRRHTPKVKTGPHCKSCSLQNICLPELMVRESVSEYMERRLRD